MHCEVCGRDIERPVKAEIEGVTVKVCSKCARFGTAKSPPRRHTAGKPRRAAGRQGFRTKETVLECVDDYSGVIRAAREKKGMKREDLGRMINEKESVIARLESGSMVPDTKLARKVERALSVKILEAVEDEEFSGGARASGGMTIGDLIK